MAEIIYLKPKNKKHRVFSILRAANKTVSGKMEASEFYRFMSALYKKESDGRDPRGV